MQLAALKHRMTAGQLRRRAAKIARRRAAGIAAIVPAAVQAPKRKHRTWKELVRRAFRRSLKLS